jgi:hypothetical protein
LTHRFFVVVRQEGRGRECFTTTGTRVLLAGADGAGDCGVLLAGAGDVHDVV